MRKSKPMVSLLLTFLLVFSNLSLFTASAESLSKSPNTNSVSTEEVIVVDRGETDKLYQQSDRVRVLVEMKAEPGISQAIKAGVQFDQLPKGLQKKLHNDATKSQGAVRSALTRKSLNVKVLENFTVVTNGFSAEITYGDIAEIEITEGVKAVYVVNEYERPDETPEMLFSKEMVNAQKTWDDFDYKGEGLVIGIIDTGIDPSHRDMILSEEVQFKVEKADLNDLGLPGKWFTDKVPYGYNYMDKSLEILDLGPGASHHGMHVAGTAAANGDEENGGIKGVAPEAQLLALKVFGNDPLIPSTYGDIYVKAIDDAIKLGVDVLNLSLGSVAGFVSPNDPEQQAVKRAQESGVVVAISAGNSAHFGNGFALPQTSNPDIGVTGAPSVSYESIGVASSENQYIEMSALEYNSLSGENGLLSYMVSGSVDPTTLVGEFEVVYAGLGGVDDFNNIDVEGKVALIERGLYPFVEKTLNAQANGAVASIVFNNTSGYLSMASDPEIAIPHLFMARTDGQKLRAFIESEEDSVTVEFKGEKTIALNPDAGKMSNFTSWGLTPNLDFKPEITAPGGNILSTLQDNKYGLMSGTSMAAPHVSGGAALIFNRVDKEFGLDGAERSLLAKNLLMNTAVTKKDIGSINTHPGVGGAQGWSNYYSPRRQGAGQMDLHAASSTPAYVVNPVDGEAKVALRQVTDNVTFELEVVNFSDEAVIYNIEKKLQTDLAGWGEIGYFPNELEAVELTNAPFVAKISGQEVTSVEVAAGEKVIVTFDINLANATLKWPGGLAKDVFPNGYFAEGFVTFVDPTDVNPSLSVPFVGFNGQWDQAPVIDKPMYEEESFYGMTGLIDNEFSFLGFKPGSGYLGAEERLAFSPSSTAVTPVLSFLRNAKDVQYNILDSEGKRLRTIFSETNVRKNYFDRGSAAQFRIISGAAWNGKVRNNIVADGLYYYEVKTRIDFEEAEWQTFRFPIYVDTIAPTVEASFDAATSTLTWSAEDTGSGVSHFDVSVNGESILEEVIPSNQENEYSLLLEDLVAGSTITVEVFDFAKNVGATEILGAGDTSILNMYVTHPNLLGIYNSLEIPIEGYIVNASAIKTFTVHGQEVELMYNEETKRYNFKSSFTVEADGVYDIPLYVKDIAGNEAFLSRQILVDSTKAVLTVEAPTHTLEDVATVTLHVKDNFDSIRVLVDGDEVFNQEFKSPYKMRAFDQSIKYEVTILDGENNFTVEVFDLAGNLTETTFTIIKGEEEKKGNSGKGNGKDKKDKEDDGKGNGGNKGKGRN
ncbi:S8 family serine peptidase [Bacillaceae bacterium IKA-2]|nr:S8 family serine peptidase [Bacillaceae bacterium IKA-2]